MNSKTLFLSTALLIYLSVMSVVTAVAGNRGTSELDELDRQEFNAHLERASSCMKSGDFNCAARELGNARKYANGPQDNQTLATATQAIELERQRRMFADAQGKYDVEREKVDRHAANAEREAAATNRANDRMAAYDNAERQSRELASRSDSNIVTPADIINRQIQKNAAEAQAMIHQVNRQTAQANAQIARASEQKRTQDRSQNDRSVGSSPSSRTTSTSRSDTSNAGTSSTSDSSDLKLTAASTSSTTSKPSTLPGAGRRYSAEPDPYDKEPFTWHKMASALGEHATRGAACRQAQDMVAKEKARVAGIGGEVYAVTPCVCAVNEGFQPSLAVYEQWAVDRYSCKVYYKNRQLVGGATISK